MTSEYYITVPFSGWLRGRDILHGNFRLLNMGNFVVAIQILFMDMTFLCCVCCGVCSSTMTYFVRVVTCGQEMLTFFGMPGSVPFGEFMI